jgi:ABC-2 type transport system ATP-binding protein
MNATATTVRPTSQPAIDLANVRKVYKGKVHALRGIQIRVHPGEVFGLLGPNGAGKSTLVKILTTVIRPTQAQGTLLGHPVGHKPTLARIGYLPEHHRFPEYLTGAQVVDFFGALADVPRIQRRKRRAELLDLVGMTQWADSAVKQYSKGMRQRIGIAQALVNDPDLVILDEPTDGVDPIGRRDIRNILVRLRDQGKTVLLNSHLLSELEMVCDRVSILVQGQVAQQGTIDELTRDHQRVEIEAAADEPQLEQAVRDGAASDSAPPNSGTPHLRGREVGRLPTGEPITLEAGTIRVATSDSAKVQWLIDALRRRGVVITSMRSLRPSLEDLFIAAVTDPVTGIAAAPGARKDKPQLKERP